MRYFYQLELTNMKKIIFFGTLAGFGFLIGVISGVLA
jgi:hypothetical protein